MSGQRPADRRARLPALVPVRRSRAPAHAADARRLRPQPLAVGRQGQLDARVGARSEPVRRRLSHDRRRHGSGADGLLGMLRPAPDPAVATTSMRPPRRCRRTAPSSTRSRCACACATATGSRPRTGARSACATIPACCRATRRPVGGEPAAAPSYVDLEGRHQLDLVFATTDGQVHALRPDGSEVPGFPVSSDHRARDRPAQSGELPGPRVSRPGPARRARAAERDRRRRSVPRRPLGDRRHERERGRLRVGCAGTSPARLPAALRSALLVPAGPDAPGADAARAPALARQLVAAGAGRPRGHRPARHPDERLRRLRVRIPARRAHRARVARRGQAAAGRLRPLRPRRRATTSGTQSSCTRWAWPTCWERAGRRCTSRASSAGPAARPGCTGSGPTATDTAPARISPTGLCRCPPWTGATTSRSTSSARARARRCSARSAGSCASSPAASVGRSRCWAAMAP